MLSYICEHDSYLFKKWIMLVRASAVEALAQDLAEPVAWKRRRACVATLLRSSLSS